MSNSEARTVANELFKAVNLPRSKERKSIPALFVAP